MNTDSKTRTTLSDEEREWVYAYALRDAAPVLTAIIGRLDRENAERFEKKKEATDAE